MKVLIYPGAENKEAYIADVSVIDTTTNTVVKSILTDGTQGWNSGNITDNYWVSNDATGRVTIMDFDEKYFLNLGDYNDDGIVDIRDLVRLKKFAAGQQVTVNEKAFVTDGTEPANELAYCVRLLLGTTYKDFKAELNFF